MPSSISSSEDEGVEAGVEPGQGPNAHHGPLSPGLRLTASDRPGIAQPVPQRDVPALPWAKMLLIALLLVLALTAAWEVYAWRLGFEAGDLGDDPSAWAAQRRRLNDAAVPVAIVGDSRILFDTDLDRFQAMTGMRPVQLALEGTNARPFLQDVADNSRFKGLLIVGITELSYFRKGVGRGRDSLERGKFESPGQRISFEINRGLRRGLAFLDPDASFSTMVARIDHSSRKGAYGPYDDVWKLATVHDDRQFAMWSQIERNPFLRAHAIRMWRIIYGFPGPDAGVTKLTLDETRAAVAKIRARGGEVVFVRPPSAPELRAMEDKSAARGNTWDPLLVAARVKGIHADDIAGAQALAMPELSHLSAACQPVFTDMYVRALARMTDRLRLLDDAPGVLGPGDCR